MAEQDLVVQTTPHAALTITNHMYVAKGTFPMRGRTDYVIIPGQARGAPDYVYTIEENDAVEAGSIAVNRIQRTCCKLSVGIDRIRVRLWKPPAKNFLLANMSLEIDFANPKRAEDAATVDMERLISNFKRQYGKQIFAVDQEFGVDFEGAKFKFTVRETQVLNEDTSSLEIANDGLKAVHYMGMLTEDTNVAFSKKQGRKIQFTNVPAGVAPRPSNDKPPVPSNAMRFVEGASTGALLQAALSRPREVNFGSRNAPQQRTCTTTAHRAQPSTRSNLLKAGFNFESYGIGGLDAEADQVFRRAFASRIFPASFLSRLGVSHVKGILLYGPPGCGKTLMARQVGKMLNCVAPKIVNGPEILSKFVGESEKNVRALFEPAEKEMAEKGDESELHLIIFDEFDAIVKQRGSTRDNTGVADSVVNQLLSKIDGVDCLNNVLLVAMTNRKDLIDEALLRPGRFEVQIEVKLPDYEGRKQIFNIHIKKQQEAGVLGKDVDIATLAANAKNYTGAEIEGVVRAAASFALNRLIDYKDPTKPISQNINVTMEDFLLAMEDVKPAFGMSKDLSSYKRQGIFDYGQVWQEQMRRCMSYIAPLKSGGAQQVQSVLLEGAIGTGKTALAAHMAECSTFPFIKVVTGDDMTGYFENSKVNYIKKAFDDAHKSPYSVVILDELEDLIDYVSEGPRFSSLILQTLRRSIKRLPPEGSRILIIGTTSCPNAMKQLDFFNQWDVVHKVLELSRSDVPAILNHMGVRFTSPKDEKEAINCHLMPRYIAIKRLMQVAEMARALALGPDGLPELADKRH
eukprot:gene17431-26794_t